MELNYFKMIQYACLGCIISVLIAPDAHMIGDPVKYNTVTANEGIPCVQYPPKMAWRVDFESETMKDMIKFLSSLSDVSTWSSPRYRECNTANIWKIYLEGRQ